MKLIICLTIAALIAYAESHARMEDPMNRGGLWRLDAARFPEQDDNEWCNEPTETPLRKNVKCGVCGPIFNNDPKEELDFVDSLGERFPLKSFERGSPVYTGHIVREYKQGSVINVTLHVDIIHEGGPITFSVADALNADPTQATLNKNKLLFADHDETTIDIHDASHINGQKFTYSLVLPENLTCEHCILQVMLKVLL